METLTLEHANAMPAPTWHRLHMNDIDIELPSELAHARQIEVSCEESLRGEAGAFEAALEVLEIPTLPEENEEEQASSLCAEADGVTQETNQGKDEDQPDFSDASSDLETPALSLYQQEAKEMLYLSPAEVFTTGMGAEPQEYLQFVAGEPVVFATKTGENTCATVRINGVDGAANAAAIDVVAAPKSSLSLAIALDSPAEGSGVVGILLRVFAGADARVDISVTQTLDDAWVSLDDAGIVLDARARVNVRHTVLGAGRSYTGLDADIRGNDARLDIDTRYLGHASQLRDFNYVAHQRGLRTVCNLDASGVLAGESTKTMRGTIELVHGCKGSVGSEQETVLLADERVVNLTVPVILCDEDDVAGNHGATIGHVRPEQLFYLASRGISPTDAERLFITASFEEAAISAPDEPTRAAVSRLAATRGVHIEEDAA